MGGPCHACPVMNPWKCRIFFGYFPIPTLNIEKTPILANGRDTGISYAKNAVGVSKNIPPTTEGIIRRM